MSGQCNSALNAVYVWTVIWILLCRCCQCEDMCWSTFGNHQFRVYPSDSGKVFDEAAELCEGVNTTLASIHSAEEDTFMEDFVMTQMSVPLWIGLRRHEDTLTWVDGTDVDYVYPKYRRKSYTDSCIYMFQGWIDGNCKGAELYFICKREVTDAGSCLTTTEEPPTTTTLTTTTTTTTTTAPPTTTTTTPPTTTTDPTTTIETTTTTDKSSSTSTTTTKSERLTTDVLSANSYTSSTTSSQTSPTDTLSTTDADSSTTSGTSSVQSSTSVTDGSTTTEREITFEELLEEMTIQERPVYNTREGKNSQAIGSVSWLILLAIIVGVVLLDLTTIKKHVNLFKKNIRGVCRRHKTSTVDLRMIDMNLNGKRC